MTDIFDVFTKPRRDNVLTGSVQYRDPDNHGYCQGAVFGLQLIMDAWQRRGHVGAQPVSAATEAEFKKLFEMYLGPEVRVDEQGYLLEEGSDHVRIPPVKAKEFYEGQLHPLGGNGFSDGNHYIQLAPQPDEFARRTAEIIISWEIREDDATNLNEDGGTSAGFTLVVSDPRYLDHFTECMHFRTAFTGHLPSF